MHLISKLNSHGIYYLLILLVLWADWAHGIDICAMGNDKSSENMDSAALAHTLHSNSVPQAGKRSGTFNKIPEIKDWINCVVLCCMQDSCDVVLIFNETCYMIECNTSVPHGCDPVERANATSTMIIVRPPRYLGGLDAALSRSTDGRASDKSSEPFQPEMCEFGLKQCQQNEDCVLPEGHLRQGICQCVTGYQRATDNICHQPIPSPTPPSEVKIRGDHEDQTVKTTAKPTDPAVTKLTVSAGEAKVIQLPENTILLSAYVLPKAEQDENYHYEWTPVAQPEGSENTATMENKNTENMKLSNLIAGLYRLKVQVTAENKFGEAYVNVTVLPVKRQNTPPVAIIVPASQQVKSENSFILDGSDSTDDDGITTYHWEEVSGPLQEHKLDDTQTLKLQNMVPGVYVFRLTVTDTDGASNSTFANVTVIKDTDYPPKANAGSDVIIYLPQNSVELCGNASTDDKGIASYEWMKKTDLQTADMTGVRMVCLRLNNLELGDYMFTLKVTDTGGNTGTADVHVYVKPATNRPPEAHTAGEITVTLPSDSILLDGHNSSDDKAIKAYKWTQTGGPVSLTVSNSDQALAVTTGIIETGDYEFKLTVTDEEEQTASDKLKVHVKLNENRAPAAKSGGDRVVLLPVSIVLLDGSASTDDRGITSYLWERDPESLAAGDVVNNSDHHAVLQLLNLVAGHYVFTLTVTDEQGLSSKDTASLLVKNSDNYKDLVQLVLDTDIHHFTQEDKMSVVKQLELLIHESTLYSGTYVQVLSMQLEQTKGQLRLLFYVHNKKDGSVVTGVDIMKLLRDKLDNGVILKFPIITLDTVLCQNNCSGHGQCDQRSKQCHCEAFWMPNIVRSAYGPESNCEWSILYVVIVCFVVIVASIVGVWGTICCCRSKRCRIKTKKRHRYSLLREVDDDDDKTKLELMPKNKIQNSSVMISESDFSSEEETLFINSKPANGHAKLNGVVPREQARKNLRT